MPLKWISPPDLVSQQRTCQGVSRREFVQVGLSSVLGLTSADLMRVRANPGGETAPRARSVILLWLWGGPAQLDTWDPKPNAPLDFRGPFSSIPTRVAGTRIGELFPQIADLADRFAILRSLHTSSSDHGVAGTIGLTGSIQGSVNLGGQAAGGAVRPASGSVVARARRHPGSLPPFLVVGGKLHQGKKSITGEGGGTLGALYDPFRLEYDAEAGFRIPALQLPRDLTPERLHDRQRLLDTVGLIERQAAQLTSSRSIDDYRAQALAMLTSPDALRLFDLS